MGVGIALSYIAQWTGQQPYVMNNYKFCSVEREQNKKCSGETRKTDGGEETRDRRKKEKEEREKVDCFGFGADEAEGDY
ncbi:hypothetical protein TrST_g13637 [Triparma strigata]|uniref:Uncharacterized protein n=2 Tax=Triparma TaxID=722752 RepID=A0A9W7F0N6_9STRA|nr:hypothetical protein TrST_g13637 [Triparma strigata]